MTVPGCIGRDHSSGSDRDVCQDRDHGSPDAGYLGHKRGADHRNMYSSGSIYAPYRDKDLRKKKKKITLPGIRKC